MDLVKQEQIFLATEETSRTCEDSRLTRLKPLKNHTKKKKKRCA